MLPILPNKPPSGFTPCPIQPRPTYGPSLPLVFANIITILTHWPSVNPVTFYNIQHLYSRLNITKDHTILLTGTTVEMEWHYQPQHCPPSSESFLLLVSTKTSANFPGLFRSLLLLPSLLLTVVDPASNYTEKNNRSYLEATHLILTSSGPITFSAYSYTWQEKKPEMA